MGIVDEDIARVRDATDAVGVIGEHVALRRVGRRWVGLCPFHAEKTPSFSVNAEAGLYYCFGCQAKGDVITFVREIEHADFVGAVEHLAKKANIQLRYDDASGGKDRRRRQRLQDAVASAVEWYHQRLLSAPDAAPARAYLRSRGYDGDVVRTYRIGWAPDDWDALARALDEPPDVLRDAGLAFTNRRNRLQDVFRGRVLFPIYDPSGQAVGFGGRVLPGGDGPKYKNSSDSALYQKSGLLYGLNWAKADVVAADEIVVCEGYTDVIGFAQAGIPRAVATCGTALTAEHVRLMRSFARRIVLAYDADAAGQGAAERMYEWEQTYEVDVAVAALPSGSDPGDLARDDPRALEQAVADARPFLQFRVERVLAAADLDTPEGRARAAEAALAVVAEHPSDLVRDQYVMQVADRCRLPADQLRRRLAAGAVTPPWEPVPAARGGHRGDPGPTPPHGSDASIASDRDERPGPASAPARDHARLPGPEVEALRLAVQDPGQILDRLDDVLFSDDRCVAAHRALMEAGGDVRVALEHADPAAADLLQRVAVEDTGATVDDVVGRLATEAARRGLLDLEREARMADRPLEYAPSMSWLKLTLEHLQRPAQTQVAVEQLVSWLRQRAAQEQS